MAVRQAGTGDRGRQPVPPIAGRELMLTLNSQRSTAPVRHNCAAQRVLSIVGGGLIGSELAMDFCRAGKTVTLMDNAASLRPTDATEVSSRYSIT